MSEKNLTSAIRSMTGYGQGAAEIPGLKVTAELRSVNSRYTDFRFRLPSEMATLEPELRRQVLARVRRGRVDISIKTEALEAGAAVRTVLNRERVRELLEAVRALHEDFGVQGSLDAGMLLAIPGTLRPEAEAGPPGPDEREAFGRALEAGLRALDEDRRREGGRLAVQILQRVTGMRRLAGEAARHAAGVPPALRDRLVSRLERIAGEVDLDSQRVAQEAVVLAERCDVTEELERLGAHLEQVAALIDEPDGEPLGRRLDFLLQEIQRETNTATSKSTDLDLTREMLALKLETEKVREQVQNLE